MIAYATAEQSANPAARPTRPEVFDSSDFLSDLLGDGAPVADLAAAKMDFAAWLQTRSERERGIIRSLGEGNKSSQVAREFDMHPATIRQLRNRLFASWHAFQGGFVPALSNGERPALDCPRRMRNTWTSAALRAIRAARV
jgi:hypothetical protein